MEEDRVKENLQLIPTIKSDVLKKNQFGKVLTTSSFYLRQCNYQDALKSFEMVWIFLKKEKYCKVLEIDADLKYAIRLCLCYCNAKNYTSYEFSDALSVIEELKAEYPKFKFPYYVEVLHYFKKRDYAKSIDCINTILKMKDFKKEIKSVSYYNVHVLNDEHIPEFNKRIFKHNTEIIGLFSYMREYCIETGKKQNPIDESAPIVLIFEKLIASFLSKVKKYGLDETSENYTDIRKKYKHHQDEISRSYVQIGEYFNKIFQKFLNTECDIFRKLELYPQKVKMEFQAMMGGNKSEENTEKRDSKRNVNVETATETEPIKIKHRSTQSQLKIKDEFTQTDLDSNHLNDNLEETSLENILKSVVYVKENIDFDSDELIKKHLNEELAKEKEKVENEEAKNKEKVIILIKESEKWKEDNLLLMNEIGNLNKITASNKTEIRNLQDNIRQLLQEKYQNQMKEYDKREQEYNFMIHALTNIKSNLNKNTPFTDSDCIKYIQLFTDEYRKILEAKAELISYFQKEIINETNKFRAIQYWPSVPEMNLDHLSSFLEKYKQTFALLNSFSLE